MPGDSREFIVRGNKIDSAFRVRVLVPNRNVDIGDFKVN